MDGPSETELVQKACYCDRHSSSHQGQRRVVLTSSVLEQLRLEDVQNLGMCKTLQTPSPKTLGLGGYVDLWEDFHKNNDYVLGT